MPSRKKIEEGQLQTSTYYVEFYDNPIRKARATIL